jgi:hypothetical protein
MSSLRALRRKSCEGKVAHASMGAAWIVASRTRGEMRPYRCKFCGHYHVGHEPSKQQRRRQNGHGA